MSRKRNSGDHVGCGTTLRPAKILPIRKSDAATVSEGYRPHSSSASGRCAPSGTLCSAEHPVCGSDSPLGCHSLPPTALRLPRGKGLRPAGAVAPWGATNAIWGASIFHCRKMLLFVFYTVRLIPHILCIYNSSGLRAIQK